MKNRPKKIPTGCSLRFTPKPPSRVFGRPMSVCIFSGGPWAGAEARTRTGPTLPITLRGGRYLPSDTGRGMNWSPA